MPEIFRSRDCIVFVKGDSIPVAVDNELIQNGWTGGSGAAWVDSAADNFLVTRSDGEWGGFFIWGSNEEADQYTAITNQFPYYGYGQLLFGGNIISTSSFEQYTWASRNAGPLVPLVYNAQDQLRFSLRGLWTKEDEWTLSGDPRAPNNNINGVVVQVPKPSNNNFLAIQTFM